MPFKPGQSGNPRGRAPRGQTFAETLRTELAAERAGLTNRERIARVVVAKAVKGDLDAVKWIVERIDGKVPDRVEADVDARFAPAIDERTRLAVLAHAARRRGLVGGAG